jgi:hypothetical protein
VLNDALTQLVRRTHKFRLKGTNYRRSLQKQPLDIQTHIRCMPPKNIAANHNVQQDHVISMEIHKEIHFHESGRFKY